MGNVKFIGNRISYKEGDKETTVIISGKIDRKKFTLLTTWLLAFTFCGIAIFSQLFLGYSREMKIGIVVFTSFWVYFEYKLIKVWMWRKNGREYLKFSEGKLILKRAVKEYGKAHEFLLGNIRQMSLKERNIKSFSQELENSFWVIGGEAIRFEYNGREVGIGVQLEEKEGKELLKMVQKWTRQYTEN